MENISKYLLNEVYYAMILIGLGLIDYAIFLLLLFLGYPITALYSFILIYVIGSTSFYIFVLIKTKKIYNLLINIFMNIIRRIKTFDAVV